MDMDMWLKRAGTNSICLMHRSSKRCLISGLKLQLKADHQFHPEVYLPQSQGSQCCEYPLEQFGVNRYRCLCLCKTWVFCASFSGGLPKGRKVCEDQWCPRSIAHTSQGRSIWTIPFAMHWHTTQSP